MNLGMPVGESKSTRVIMIAGRVIDDLGGVEIGVAIHLADEIGVIDAVLALVKNDVSQGRAGVEHLAQLVINQPVARQSPVTFVPIVRFVTIAAGPIAHRDAAARDLFAFRIYAEGSVGWTMPDANRIS